MARNRQVRPGVNLSTGAHPEVSALNNLIRIAILLASIFATTTAGAQQDLVADPERYEREHFDKKCKIAQYEGNFAKRLDFNNDGIEDIVINEGAITCDGERQFLCNSEGCPHNFYVQVKEGGYIMIATAQVFSYDFIPWYGYSVLKLMMNPRYCDRTTGAPCEMTVRVRGTKFVTIGKK